MLEIKKHEMNFVRRGTAILGSPVAWNVIVRIRLPSVLDRHLPSASITAQTDRMYPKYDTYFGRDRI